MLQVRNIGSHRVSVKTTSPDGQGSPLVMNLGPGDFLAMSRAELHRWPYSAKENMADYVAAELLEVAEVDCVHTTRDMAVPSKTNAMNRDEIIRDANTLKGVFNKHVTNAAIHTAADAANVLVSPNATDLTTLITLLTEIVNKYNLHRVSAVHPNSDIWVILTVALPLVTWDDCMRALFLCCNALTQHRRKLVPLLAPVPLTAQQVIEY